VRFGGAVGLRDRFSLGHDGVQDVAAPLVGDLCEDFGALLGGGRGGQDSSQQQRDPFRVGLLEDAERGDDTGELDCCGRDGHDHGVSCGSCSKDDRLGA